MLKFKRSSVVLFMLIGMLGVSSVAFAEHEESHDEDTRFSFGYDMENHLLAINLGAKRHFVRVSVGEWRPYGHLW